MKKNIARLSILLTLCFIACQKGSVTPSELLQREEFDTHDSKRNLELNPRSLQFVNEGRFLDFPTRKIYEGIISDWNQESDNLVLYYLNEINHESWLKFAQNSGDPSLQELVPDDYFASLLSKERTIKIGDYIFKINPNTEQVLALHKNNIGQYQDLLNDAVDEPNILTFSVQDDVLEMVENLVVSAVGDDVLPSISSDCGGVSGDVYPSYSDPYLGKVIKEFPDGSVWRLNPFARFFAMGVYFHLTSQFEIHRFPSEGHTTDGQVVSSNISNDGVEIEMFIKWPEAWWKQRPCRNNSVGTKKYGHHYTESIYGKAKKTVNRSARNFNGFYFFIQGRARYSDGSVTLATPYGGRNINSPY